LRSKGTISTDFTPGRRSKEVATSLAVATTTIVRSLSDELVVLVDVAPRDVQELDIEPSLEALGCGVAIKAVAVDQVALREAELGLLRSAVDPALEQVELQGCAIRRVLGRRCGRHVPCVALRRVKQPAVRTVAPATNPANLLHERSAERASERRVRNEEREQIAIASARAESADYQLRLCALRLVHDDHVTAAASARRWDIRRVPSRASDLRKMGGNERVHLSFAYVARDPDEKRTPGDVPRVEFFGMLDADARKAVGVSTQGAPVRVLAKERLSKTHRTQDLVVVEPGGQRRLGPPFELREVAPAKRGVPNYIAEKCEQRLQIAAKHRGANARGTHRHFDRHSSPEARQPVFESLLRKPTGPTSHQMPSELGEALLSRRILKTAHRKRDLQIHDRQRVARFDEDIHGAFRKISTRVRRERRRYLLTARFTSSAETFR
jgi:hypothetical protein